MVVGDICIIPARGGSKRIPRKNIRSFCGKPMIAWSIEAARRSGCFEQILVSSDDEEISEVARSFGAIVPFTRPGRLSDDFVGITPVVAHAVQWCLDQGYSLNAVCCLLATSPFVQSADLKQGSYLLGKMPNDRFVFTVTTYSSIIQRALKINSTTGEVQMWLPENFAKRSQDLEELYHDAGQFYWGRPDAWLSTRNLFEGSQVLILPRWRVQDIDTEDDWYRAELIKRVLITDCHDD